MASNSDQLALYPVYFDRKRSVRNGRKVPMNCAVECPNPYVLLKCLEQLGYEASFEQAKRHPRDPMTFGRIKVSMASNSSSKSTLMLQVCRLYEQVKVTLDPQLLSKTAPKSAAETPVTEPSGESTVKKPAAKGSVAIGPGGVVLVARSKKNKSKR